LLRNGQQNRNVELKLTKFGSTESGHILFFCGFAAFAARCRLRRTVRFFLILMRLCHPRGKDAKSVGENTLWLAVTALRKRQSRKTT